MATYILTVGLRSAGATTADCIDYSEARKNKVRFAVHKAVVLDAEAVVYTEAEGTGFYLGMSEPCLIRVFSSFLDLPALTTRVRNRLLAAECGDQDCFHLSRIPDPQFPSFKETSS